MSIVLNRHHRRRIKTQEKTKVVAAAWDEGIDSTTVAIFHHDDFKEKD